MTDSSPVLGTSSAVLEEQLAITWHCAALLLGRPDRTLVAQLESIHRATHQLPDALGGPLRATVVHLERAPLDVLEEEYRTTFDGSDLGADAVTRLSAALETAACADADVGCALVEQELPSLEELQAQLSSTESGWAGAANAVTASLTQAATAGAR